MSDEETGLIVRALILVVAMLLAFLAVPLVLGTTYATGLVSGGILGALIVEATKWFFSK